MDRDGWALQVSDPSLHKFDIMSLGRICNNLFLSYINFVFAAVISGWQYYVSNFPNCIYSWKGIFNIQSKALETTKEDGYSFCKTLFDAKTHSLCRGRDLVMLESFFKSSQITAWFNSTSSHFYRIFLIVCGDATTPKKMEKIGLWSFVEKVLTSRPKSFYWWKGWQESACHFMDIGNI